MKKPEKRIDISRYVETRTDPRTMERKPKLIASDSVLNHMDRNTLKLLLSVGLRGEDYRKVLSYYYLSK